MPGILSAKKVGRRKGPVAVIDIGSNSIRLVVYDGAKRAPLPVFNEKVICGLGRGLDASGEMTAESIELAINALLRFVALTDSMGVRRVQAVATAAVREATNGPAFVRRVAQECGLDVRVLSGNQEAQLSGFGVLSAIPDAQGIMGDLGGGSVELVKFSAGKLEEKATLPLGALRSAGAEKSSGDLTGKMIDRHLSQLSWLGDVKGETFYAVGGAWRALARIHMDQVRYPIHVIHQYSLNAADALKFARFVGNLSRNTLGRVHGVSRQRIESVPYALREGCLYERLSKKRRMQDSLIAMTQEVAGRAGRATSDGDRLADWIAPVFPDQEPRSASLRLAAANLADIGWSEHPDYRAEQVFLRILRMPLVGLEHSERAMLALTVASRHSAMDTVVRRWRIDTLLDEGQILEARSVGLAMRLAYTLTGGAIELLETTRVERLGDRLILTLPDHADILVGDVVERRFRALAKSLNCEHEVIFTDEKPALAATA